MARKRQKLIRSVSILERLQDLARAIEERYVTTFQVKFGDEIMAVSWVTVFLAGGIVASLVVAGFALAIAWTRFESSR